ncbi:MAG: PIG-L family deacetylase [Coxiellaceae bacterium]|nr:PIG-L family deacetylase [Coxiellaceae bacterium]
MAKVLVIAAHPDDEILGCGATMARHVSHNDKVKVVLVSEGLTSRVNSTADEAALTSLREQARQANQVLGVSDVAFLSQPDNRLDSIDRLDLTQAIEKEVESFKPEIIYTHFQGDLNIDHRRVFESVLTACRPQPESDVKKILSFEVQSSTEWAPFKNSSIQPNYYVNVSYFLQKKIDALQAYAGEMRDWPHARSYEAVVHLAKWRGSNVGVEAAEGFELIRELVF